MKLQFRLHAARDIVGSVPIEVAVFENNHASADRTT